MLHHRSGVHRHDERNQDRQLAVTALDTGRAAPEQVEGAPSEGDHLFVGEDVGRPVDGPLVVVDGAVDRAGPVEVDRDLPGHGVERTAMELDEGIGDLEVELPAPSRAEVEVGDLADLVVAEVVPVGAALPHDPPAPQLVERQDDLAVLAGQPVMTSIENARPITAATPATSRALVLSWARRRWMTVCILGGSPPTTGVPP